MISNAQKGKRINAILQKLVEDPKSEKAATALYRLLIGDCEGKLYKYMPIKKYTVPSLENNALHVSSPSAFNDPFDCKIGIDIQSLIKAIIPTDQLELCFSDFMAYIKGSLSLESIPDERKNVITHWINNRVLTDFIANSKGKHLSDSEIDNLLFDNFEIFFEWVFPLIEEILSKNGTSINAAELFKMLYDLPNEAKKQIIEVDGSYSDFIKSLGVADDTDEIGLTEKALEKIEPQSTEALLKFKDAFEKIEQNLNVKLCSLFKVCCFSTDYKNKLMWSHYADSHRGICVEYDFSDAYKNNMPLLPVCYSKNRMKVPWSEAISQSAEQQSKLTASFMKALLTKDEIWRYEQEWRILVSAEDGVDSIPAPPIKCIYIGALCSEDNVNKIKETANKMNFCVKRMTVDRGEYELHAMSF